MKINEVCNHIFTYSISKDTTRRGRFRAWCDKLEQEGMQSLLFLSSQSEKLFVSSKQTSRKRGIVQRAGTVGQFQDAVMWCWQNLQVNFVCVFALPFPGKVQLTCDSQSHQTDDRSR